MLVFILVSLSSSLKVDESKPITKIAFGSCTNMFQGNNPELHYSMLSLSPDLFLYLGDVIYADDMPFPYIFKPSPIDKWKSKYTSLKSSAEYQLLSSKTMISGVWDDHDYGINDGDKSFPLKNISKELFLDFLDDGSSRDHEGIYHSFSFKDLKIILIDIRWFRDSEKQGDSLGEEQWTWLEEQMKSKEKVKIIASGLQVNIQDRVGVYERWHDRSRLRLWKLINENHGVVLLSGDVHYAELLKVPCAHYCIYEFTSSGMGHCVYSNYGKLSWLILNIWHPFTFNMSPKYIERNFGFIEIDWEKSLITLSIHDSQGSVLYSHRFSISELYERQAESCSSSVFSIIFFHVFSSVLVFLFPFVSLFLSLIIFLRKYTNSY